jgi:ribosome-binding protein aMBF1 (putative translation factor)
MGSVTQTKTNNNIIMATPSSSREKFLAMVSETPSTWSEEAQWRIDNEGWLKKSAAIAKRVLRYLHSQKLSQSELAERMGVTRQQVNKILKGNENLTLETIYKLEKALNIELMLIADAPVSTTPEILSVSAA